MSYPFGQVAPAPGQAKVVPGPVPGTIITLETGETLSLEDWSQQPLYDAEGLPAVITPGQQFSFFRNTNTIINLLANTPKTLLETNMQPMGQLPSGWEMRVFGIHIKVQNAPGVPMEDIQAIINGSYVDFFVGGQKTERQGPGWMFPSIYGSTGFVTSDGNAGPREVTELNNGVPSPAAIGMFRAPITLVPLTSIEGRVYFPRGITFLSGATNTIMLYYYLTGFLKKPVR